METSKISEILREKYGFDPGAEAAEAVARDLDPTIVIEIVETGDTAEAETPEAALLAARTLGDEARDAMGIWGFDPTIVFRVNDQVVRSTTLRSLDREARS